jgi:hypothetical protein
MVYMLIALAGHPSPWAREKITATEAAGAGESEHESVTRRQLAASSGCAVFLSTALGNAVSRVGLSARRRSQPSLARACARPHPALVSPRNRAAGPQISLGSECSLLASQNSPTIANGLRGAKTGTHRSRQTPRSAGAKICPDLRHLGGTRFLVLSMRGAIDN